MDYLLNKNWHPGSVQNIVKVWQREQEEIRKIQKYDEYKKKLLEEQHAHELKVAQVKAGLISKSDLEKMDWMYNQILGQTPQDGEQYLLGKQVDLSTFIVIEKQKDRQNNCNKYQEIVSEDVTSSACENFTLIHQDPLFKIMQEEQKMKEKLMNNPLDMNLLMKELRKQKEFSKLANGINKKDKMKKYQKDKKNHHKDEKESKKKKNKKRSCSHSSSKDKKENGSQRNNKDKKSRKSFSKERKTKRSRSRSEAKKVKVERQRSLSPESKIQQMHYDEDLKKKVGNILVRGDDGILRPDFGLMKRKFRNNLKPEEKMKMTEEEKKERLKEMQENARELTQMRLKEFKEDYSDGNCNNNERNIKDLHCKQNNPIFLQIINKDIYTGKKDMNALADQLNMNKNRLTRDLEEKNTFK